MRHLLRLFCLALLCAAAPAYAQFQLQHSQCYAVLEVDPDVSISVGLRDQFAEEKVDVRRSVRFCNPTAKYLPGTPFTPVTDDRQHLTFYATFPQQAPLRVVVAANQFYPNGVQMITYEPVALVVPTQKLEPRPHDPPEGLDHFRCYVAGGPAVNRMVYLSDQLIPPLTQHRVLIPRLFCNPVQKTTPDGGVTEIRNPDLHLTCYAMTRINFSAAVLANNQFGKEQKMRVAYPDMLCVPSRKLRWTEIPDTPVGGVMEDVLRSVPLD
jgi:hypothetical protein